MKSNFYLNLELMWKLWDFWIIECVLVLFSLQCKQFQKHYCDHIKSHLSYLVTSQNILIFFAKDGIK